MNPTHIIIKKRKTGEVVERFAIPEKVKNLKTCVAMYKQDIQKDRSLVVVLE